MTLNACGLTLLTHWEYQKLENLWLRGQVLAAHDNERLWFGVVGGDGGSLWKMRIRSEISLPVWSFIVIEIGELRALSLLINVSPRSGFYRRRLIYLQDLAGGGWIRCGVKCHGSCTYSDNKTNERYIGNSCAKHFVIMMG